MQLQTSVCASAPKSLWTVLVKQQFSSFILFGIASSLCDTHFHSFTLLVLHLHTLWCVFKRIYQAWKCPTTCTPPPILSSLWYSFISSQVLKFQKNFLFLRDLSSLEQLLMGLKTELVRASGTVSKFKVRRTHSLNHSLFHLPTLRLKFHYSILYYEKPKPLKLWEKLQVFLYILI